MKMSTPEASAEPMDILSNAWCNSAIQVFQPTVDECSMVFKDKQMVSYTKGDATASPVSERSLNVDEKSIPQMKFDDLKSWIWLQKAIHPELDYDLVTKSKWFSKKFTTWKGTSIKKWFKEIKQKKKEEGRLQKAELHAAISVAGVAAALAAIAAEKTEVNQQNSLKDTAVASAAALVAAQCAQVAEAVGANREQLSSAINAAITATDTSNIVTLTAAAATSLRCAATLRGRPGQNEKRGTTGAPLCDDLAYGIGRSRESLSKGGEIVVETDDGKCKLRSVSAVLNKDAKVIIGIKKINVLKAFSSAKESIVYNLRTDPCEKAIQDSDGYYCIEMKTSKGSIKLKINEYVRYRKWITTINHMIMLSTNFSRQELGFYRS